MKNEIKLVQKPVITHELVKMGESVTNRLAELNIENQVATTETVKSLKDLRAELNKELAGFEEQRMVIKKAVANPYQEFEALYKTEISEKYKDAIDKLKAKISSVEMKLKEEKEANLKVYFIELCQSENIDFLVFGNIALEIGLSTTETAYKKKINEFINRVSSDLELIETQEHKVEIRTEYKKNLNVSESIKTIVDRKEAERQEAERVKQIEWNRRVLEFRKIGMTMDEETKTFVYNDAMYVSIESVSEISKQDFADKIIDFDEKIKAFNKGLELPYVPVAFKEEVKTGETPQAEPIKKAIEKKQTTEPLKKPVAEEKLPIVSASFEVKGTLPQLKALGAYMKQNNITYKNK